MTDPIAPLDRLRPLTRVRQIREFTPESVGAAELDAILEVARWTGSSANMQPCRFVVIREPTTLRRIAEVGLPQTRSFRTAAVGIAISVPDEPERASSWAYDEGRAAERILIAASLLDLGAGIAWITRDVLPAIRELLAVPDGRLVRTIMAIGHPSEAARLPKSAPGTARLPRSEVAFEERFPAE
jgi:nitroreductase